jgi:hypothetical protein
MTLTDGVDTVQERTKKLLTNLLTEATMSPKQPTPDELFDYAYTLVNGTHGAVDALQQHAYIEQAGAQDGHYQAVVALLQQEKLGAWAQPPVAAHFDFSYLDPPVRNPWYLEVGKIIIIFTEQLLNTLTPAPSAQLVLKRAIHEIPIFTFGFEAQPGIGVQVMGKAATAEAAICNVTVELKVAARAWPTLSGIPVTLATERAGATTQLTDPFGRTHFRTLERALLSAATVTIGPLAELQADRSTV